MALAERPAEGLGRAAAHGERRDQRGADRVRRRRRSRNVSCRRWRAASRDSEAIRALFEAIASASKSRSQAGRRRQCPHEETGGRSLQPVITRGSASVGASIGTGASSGEHDAARRRPCARRLRFRSGASDLSRPSRPAGSGRPDIVADILGVGEADRVKVDEARRPFLRQRPDRFDMRRLRCRIPVGVVIRRTRSHGSAFHRSPHVVHVSRHVRPKTVAGSVSRSGPFPGSSL